ncbi:hypothetical protein WMQ31_10850 [Vibrio alginolyticus]
MSSFPDLLTSFEEAVEALKVKLSQDPNSSTNYNGEYIQSLAKDIEDRWAAISAMVQGRSSFETKADLLASGAPPAGQLLAEVWRDSTLDDNGLYGWTGSAWEKSVYDVIQKIAQFESDIAELKSQTSGSGVVDVSLLTGNYQMTLEEAIAAVPAPNRKQNIVIKFNDIEQYRFYASYTEQAFTSIKNWLRPTDTLSAGDLNLANGAMLYRGFCFTASNSPAFHPDNAVLIIPIHRFYTDGELQKLTINSDVALQNLGISGSGVLSATLNGVSTYSGYFFNNLTIPANAEFAYINVSYNNGAETLGMEQQSFIADTIRYVKSGFENWTTSELNQRKRLVADNSTQVLTVRRDADGNDVVQTVTQYFKDESQEFNGFHLYELFRTINITKDFNDLAINTETGSLRVVYLSGLSTYGSGSGSGATIKFKIQDIHKADVFNEYQASVSYDESTGYMHGTVNMESLAISFVFDRDLAGAGYNIINSLTKDNAAISPEWIAKSLLEFRQDKKEYIYQFDICEQVLSSNYSYNPPQNLLPSLRVFDSVKEFITNGDGSYHSQNCLVADKKTDINGTKTITVDVDSTVSEQFSPVPCSIMKASSAFDGFLGYSADQVSDGQWIHPDICYCDTPVAGYKYWMVNSIYPFSYAATEDAELFVSNDGIDWQRIQHPDEIQTGDVPLNIPPTYWNVDETRQKLFMPIPATGSSMLFSDNNGESQQVILSILNHDPCILYHDGYVNVYITYNFGLGSTTRQHRYRVCYRTNDGVNWEIVREDGTAVPYNSANAQLIFTKTNGVRNHIQYYYNSTSLGSDEAGPQVVKVSDNEFYLYSAGPTYTASQDYAFGLTRYAGTSPYSFDFDNRQETTIDTPPFGRVWHVCVRYENGKFYAMYDGNMATSINGLNFVNPPVPFFWRGAHADLYKPSFCVGDDGVKFAQSLQMRGSAPATGGSIRPTKVEYDFVRNYTLICEYPSLSDIEARGQQTADDGYVDVQLTFTNERTNRYRTMLIPAVRNGTSIKNVEMLRGDRVNVKAFCNTRANGTVTFRGLLIDER